MKKFILVRLPRLILQFYKDEQRRQRYINSHKNNETWSKSGIDTAGWWSLKYLWSYPTKEEANNHMKKDLKKMGVDIV
jgi:hypothetical protein